MNNLSHREHARLARELVDACGGLDEAARNCRVSKATLSTYQNPHEAATMPADVMHALEVHCGRAVYSSAMAECFSTPSATGNLLSAACDLSEQVLAHQTAVRIALSDEMLTPRELDALAKAEASIEAAFDYVRALRRSAEGGHLRAV